MYEHLADNLIKAQANEIFAKLVLAITHTYQPRISCAPATMENMAKRHESVHVDHI